MGTLIAEILIVYEITWHHNFHISDSFTLGKKQINPSLGLFSGLNFFL